MCNGPNKILMAYMAPQSRNPALSTRPFGTSYAAV